MYKTDLSIPDVEICQRPEIFVYFSVGQKNREKIEQ